MDEQRQSVEKLFGDALFMEPEARGAFLDAACRDEPELKHQVEEMLMEGDRAASFFEKPPFDFSTTAEERANATPLKRGSRLGPYEILALVGAGGMGEVYRARDTRLGRDVAIKILSKHLSIDPDLKRRFEREARAVCLLTHPEYLLPVRHRLAGRNRLHRHGVLEGETLADRLTAGALPLQLALKIAVEIADALDKAHREGIIHRDLKPGNIMLTKSGAKLMDFGLAKPLTATILGLSPVQSHRVRHRSSSNDRCHCPGRGRRPVYGARHNHGNAPVYGPGNLQGHAADARSDIFGFGCVLYEMVSGRRPFSGESS